MLALSVESFPSIIIHSVKAKERDIKEAYLQSAFIGWQIQEIVKGAMSENPKAQRFFDYAAQIGLVEKDKPKQSTKDEISEAISIAEQIKKADQKGKT